MRIEVSRYRLEPEDIERSGVVIPILVRESTGVAMVDTGARITVIDIEYAQEVGLEEDGAHQITGATGVGEYPRFKADIEVPWLNITVRSPVGGAPLRTNNIPWNALIGRDVILQFELRVDGMTGMITFLKEEEDSEG